MNQALQCTACKNRSNMPSTSQRLTRLRQLAIVLQRADLSVAAIATRAYSGSFRIQTAVSDYFYQTSEFNFFKLVRLGRLSTCYHENTQKKATHWVALFISALRFFELTTTTQEHSNCTKSDNTKSCWLWNNRVSDCNSHVRVNVGIWICVPVICERPRPSA